MGDVGDTSFVRICVGVGVGVGVGVEDLVLDGDRVLDDEGEFEKWRSSRTR